MNHDRKTILPLISRLETYSDFKEIAKGLSSRSLLDLYDHEYFTQCAGSREHAEMFFKSGGLHETSYTRIPLRLAKITPGDVALDVGCGRGEIVFQTANLGARSVGVDFSRTAVALAEHVRRQHAAQLRSRTRFLCCNAEKLPFGRDTFDVIFMLDVVEHLASQELQNVLHEIKRVMKKSGKLIIHSTPNLWSRTYGQTLKAVGKFILTSRLPKDPFILELKEKPTFIMHINEQSPLSLKSALRRSGFRSSVWLDWAGNPWTTRRDLPGRLLSLVYDILCAKYLFGSHLYAIAYSQ